MRLWDWRLIPYLPRTQLLSQWRELNSIFKKQDKHILINYVYEYPEEDLKIYSWLVCGEIISRGYKIKNPVSLDGEYFRAPFKNHHTKEYLLICYMNLREKFNRYQKDFDDEIFSELHKFVNKELDGLLDEVEARL